MPTTLFQTLLDLAEATVFVAGMALLVWMALPRGL
jgi:hypothetical protein